MRRSLTAVCGVGSCALDVPGGGVVQVWWATTGLDHEAVDVVRARVDAATATRADRFVRPADRNRSLVAHALLRHASGRVLGVEPGAVQVHRLCPTCGSTEHGRPAVTAPGGGPGPDVSLAHSGGLAVVATVTGGLRVGVDVEERRRGEAGQVDAGPADARQARVGDLVLSPSERRLVAAAPDPDRQWLRAWTGKESIVKAIGCGIATDLTAIEVLGARPVAPDWWAVEVPRALLARPAVPSTDRSSYQLAVAVLASGSAASAAPGGARSVRLRERERSASGGAA